MHAIFRIYNRQAINYWKTLGLRIKFELLALLIIFYLFFTEKLIFILTKLADQPDISLSGLSSFCGHIIILLIAPSIPLIYFKLLPRQPGIKTLRTLPLSPANAVAVMIVYIFKYELIAFIITGPLIAALLDVTGLLPVVYFLYLIIFFPVVFLLLLQFLLKYFNSRPVIIMIYLAILTLYFVIHGYLYLTSAFYYIPADILFISISMLIFYRTLSPFNETWDLALSRNHSKDLPLQKGNYTIVYNRIPAMLPRKMSAFFRRDILGHIRNKSYVRMKIFSLLLFVAGLILLMEYFPVNRPEATALCGLIFLWIHYTHQFNEKYVYAESKYFIKSMPFQYRHLWLGRFLTEILFLIPVLIISASIMIVYRADWQAVVMVATVLTVISLFILALTTNIKLIFYDNPRMAGYAYHFLVIFAAVMIGNFNLVGPVVIFFVLLYISFLSYRQFTN